MRYRLVFICGVITGYVLGSRAGRQRYEEIKRLARGMADNPALQQTAGAVQAKASALAPKATSALRSANIPLPLRPHHDDAPDTAAPVVADELSAVDEELLGAEPTVSDALADEALLQSPDTPMDDQIERDLADRVDADLGDAGENVEIVVNPEAEEALAVADTLQSAEEDAASREQNGRGPLTF